jgi:hypothetical protein
VAKLWEESQPAIDHRFYEIKTREQIERSHLEWQLHYSDLGHKELAERL